MKLDRQFEPGHLWQNLPPYARTLPTEHGPVTFIDRGVPALATEYTTPAAEIEGLQAAILRGDAANIAARVLGSILPRYPEAIRLALLRRHFSLVRLALEAIAANPNMILAELVERRMRAQSHAASEMRRSHNTLREAHCEIAFDDSAINDLAEEIASLCREVCMLLSRTMTATDPPQASFAKLRVALEGKLKGAGPLLSPESLSAPALVYRGLAEIIANAKSTATNQP